jgi:hypothetical protein
MRITSGTSGTSGTFYLPSFLCDQILPDVRTVDWLAVRVVVAGANFHRFALGLISISPFSTSAGLVPSCRLFLSIAAVNSFLPVPSLGGRH